MIFSIWWLDKITGCVPVLPINQFLVLSHSGVGKPSKTLTTRHSSETTPLWDETPLVTHTIRSQEWEGNHTKADDEDAESQLLMFDVVFPPSAQFIFFPWFLWAIFKVVRVAHCQISCWKKAQFGRWSGGTASLEYNKTIYISPTPFI